MPAIPTMSNSTAHVDEGDKRAESTSIHPVLSQVQCEGLIKEFFTQGKVRNYYTCLNKCSNSLSRSCKESSLRSLTMTGWKKSTTGGFAMLWERECFVSFVKSMELQIP